MSTVVDPLTLPSPPLGTRVKKGAAAGECIAKVSERLALGFQRNAFPRIASGGGGDAPSPLGTPGGEGRGEGAGARRRLGDHRPSRCAITVRGFTLVELLVVVAIIAILGSLVLSGLFVAQESAREARTRSLVSRLHNQLMDRWDSYATRRLPIGVNDRGGINDADFDGNPDLDASNSQQRKQIQRRQLWYRRQLMRRELPDRYYDLYFQAFVAPDLPYWPFTGVDIDSPPPPPPPPQIENPATVGQPPPWGTIPMSTNFIPYRERLFTSLFWAYHRRIEQAIGASIDPRIENDVRTKLAGIRETNQSAECLYLILTTGLTDESFGRNQFFESEIADTDGDGMFEFVDAWKRPIQFFRWAPGFDSLAQPRRVLRTGESEFSDYDAQTEESAKKRPGTMTTPDLTRILTFSPLTNYDTFDPNRLDPWPFPRANTTIKETRPERGYRLTPLIVSLGRDGKLGIDQANDTQTMVDSLNSPLSSDPYADYDSTDWVQRRGDRFSDDSISDDAETGSFSFDNIHNHDQGIP